MHTGNCLLFEHTPRRTGPDSRRPVKLSRHGGKRPLIRLRFIIVLANQR
jgi:hypothetical protein